MATGIMQGRLVPRYNGRYQSFPLPDWRKEFPLAAQLGFGAIEFIFDFENFEGSPLVTAEGHRELKELTRRTGVAVRSVCADYFMKFPVFSADASVAAHSHAVLESLITNAAALGITDITVPCVDESGLRSREQKDALRGSILRALAATEGADVNINLETDMGPAEFLAYVLEFGHPRVKINYDIGNSASLGYDPDEELTAYGKYISVLHVKDRLLHGGSVKLGTGGADFKRVFKRLKEGGFNGIIIMQAARAATYDAELAFVAEQRDFIIPYIEEYLG